MKRAKSLRAVLAAGTSRVRAERGLSEQQAAELLRSYGLVTWQVGTLTQVEAGVRPLAVEELLLLCAAYRVSLAELAGSDPDEVELAAGARPVDEHSVSRLHGPLRRGADRQRKVLDRLTPE